ncbi:MAG: hypothetical protein HYY25_11065 [Candidatus Wallbacteria bacterium]|nr:hypothetical protein [Candidatus Wallbacteria bacterium]
MRHGLVWVAAVWLAVLVFFWPVLIAGQSFYFRDAAAYHYPQACVTRDALLSGRVPLWEPRVGTGYPWQADPHSMVFYPPTLLLLLLPMPLAFNVFTVFHTGLFGTFTLLLARRWGCAWPAAGFAAASAMFSGISISTLCVSPEQHGMAWAPAAMLAFHGWLDGGRRSSLLWTALALAAQGSGSDPQLVLFTAGLLALQRWLHPPTAHRPLTHTFGGLLASGLLAGAVLAYQYLPLLELTRLSLRSGGMEATGPFTYDLVPANMPGFVLPVSFPDPGSPLFRHSWARGLPPLFVDLYWGVPVLCLALAALGSGARGAAATWAAVLVSIALALGRYAPFLAVLTALLPPLASFRFAEKYLCIAAILLPLLGGLGLDGILGGKARSRSWTGIAAAAAGGLAAFGAAAMAWKGHELAAVFSGGGVAHLKDPGRVLEALGSTWTANLAFVFATSLVFASCCWFGHVGKLTAARLALVLGTIAFADLAFSTRPSAHRTEEAYLAAPPAAASALTRERPAPYPLRYAVLDPIFTPVSDDWTVYESGLYKREMMKTLRAVPLGFNPLHETGAIPLRAYATLQSELTGGSLEARVRSAEAAGAEYTLWSAQGTSVRVSRHPGAAPRCFIAQRARAAEPAELEHVERPASRLPGEALFELPAGPHDVPASLVPTAVRTCVLRTYEPEKLDVEVELDGAGLLVILDAHYPGWSAEVDGSPRPLVRVAGHFRGVPVRSGDRRVVIGYRPRTFQVGCVVSALALLLVAAGFWVCRRRTR